MTPSKEERLKAAKAERDGADELWAKHFGEWKKNPAAAEVNLAMDAADLAWAEADQKVRAIEAEEEGK